MKKIRTLALTLLIFVFPCIAFAFEGPISPEGLTSPIETLFDVSLGMNLDDSRQVKQELTINADRTKTINQITCNLYFRNETEYNTLVNALIESATAEWGALQDEQVTGLNDKREALHRTWGKDDLHLTIATEYFPEYNAQFPYIVLISRSRS